MTCAGADAACGGAGVDVGGAEALEGEKVCAGGARAFCGAGGTENFEGERNAEIFVGSASGASSGGASGATGADFVRMKRRAEAAERALYERELSDALERGLSGVRFSSRSARRDVELRVRTAGLPLENGRLVGLDELLSSFREEDPDAFVVDDKVRFTDRMSCVGDDVDARERIMSIRDRGERRAAIASRAGAWVV